MYGEPEKQQKAKEYKHMTFYEAAELDENHTGNDDADYSGTFHVILLPERTPCSCPSSFYL